MAVHVVPLFAFAAILTSLPQTSNSFSDITNLAITVHAAARHVLDKTQGGVGTASVCLAKMVV
jgi:hypothetical protein